MGAADNGSADWDQRLKTLRVLTKQTLGRPERKSLRSGERVLDQVACGEQGAI